MEFSCDQPRKACSGRTSDGPTDVQGAKKPGIQNEGSCTLSRAGLNRRHHIEIRSRMASWRSGDAEDCKSSYPGSIPGEASNFPLLYRNLPIGFFRTLCARFDSTRPADTPRLPSTAHDSVPMTIAAGPVGLTSGPALIATPPVAASCPTRPTASGASGARRRCPATGPRSQVAASRNRGSAKNPGSRHRSAPCRPKCGPAAILARARAANRGRVVRAHGRCQNVFSSSGFFPRSAVVGRRLDSSTGNGDSGDYCKPMTDF